MTTKPHDQLLIVKFGALDKAMQEIVPKLLPLSAIDRARAVMELTREELLARFGR